MKLAALALVLATAAACGGKSSSATAPGNTGGGGAGIPPQWAPVMVEGAVFKLDNRDLEGAGDPAERTTVVATVTKVTRDADGATAELTWVDGAGDALALSLPTLIRVSGDNVWFGQAGEALDGDSAVSFPKPGGEERAGLYTQERDGVFCYGEGPGPDAGECEDVCFAELCVSAKGGIVQGAGTWWPNYEVYNAVE